MLRGVLRESGLALFSLLGSIFLMTFLLLALASVGLADAEWSYVSQALPSFILPFTIGLGTIVAMIQNRLSVRRPLLANLILVLVVGGAFSVFIWSQADLPLWVFLYFFLPGFLLWGGLSGYLARRRSTPGKEGAR